MQSASKCLPIISYISPLIFAILPPSQTVSKHRITFTLTCISRLDIPIHPEPTTRPTLSRHPTLLGPVRPHVMPHPMCVEQGASEQKVQPTETYCVCTTGKETIRTVQREFPPIFCLPSSVAWRSLANQSDYCCFQSELLRPLS